jgi:hypothetical protein
LSVDAELQLPLVEVIVAVFDAVPLVVELVLAVTLSV